MHKATLPDPKTIRSRPLCTTLTPAHHRLNNKRRGSGYNTPPPQPKRTPPPHRSMPTRDPTLIPNSNLVIKSTTRPPPSNPTDSSMRAAITTPSQNNTIASRFASNRDQRNSKRLNHLEPRAQRTHQGGTSDVIGGGRSALLVKP